MSESAYCQGLLGSDPLAANALTSARRFRDLKAMILRFATDVAVPWTNNQAERDLHSGKIQQRTSGGCWRTLAGIADFAVVTSHLSTASKWGQDKVDVLHQLFTPVPGSHPQSTLLMNGYTRTQQVLYRGRTARAAVTREPFVSASVTSSYTVFFIVE